MLGVHNWEPLEDSTVTPAPSRRIKVIAAGIVILAVVGSVLGWKLTALLWARLSGRPPTAALKGTLIRDGKPIAWDPSRSESLARGHPINQFSLEVAEPPDLGIEYQAFIGDLGLPWATGMVGSPFQPRDDAALTAGIEGVSFRLTGKAAPRYTVIYECAIEDSMHWGVVRTFGPFADGPRCGTPAYGKWHLISLRVSIEPSKRK
jgi:hypothetical protein